jgi:hypothetical protein
VRLWSLHPTYLDSKGLVALWREALLAKHVLAGNTKGYKHHPQLQRFREHPEPLRAINAYLHHVWHEATQRGYEFDKSKVRGGKPGIERIRVTSGQIEFEWKHLMKKLRTRDPERRKTIAGEKSPRLHALFRVRPGPVEDWERV